MNKNVFYNCPFVFLFIFLSLGIVVGKFFGYESSSYLFASALLFLFFGVMFSKKKFIFILLLGGGLFFVGAYNAQNIENQVFKAKKIVSFSEKYNIAGEIVSFPKSKRRENVYEHRDEFKTSFVFKANEIKDKDGDVKDFKGKLQVFIYSEGKVNFKRGDNLILKSAVNLPFKPSNYHQFDYGKYLKHKKIPAVCYIKDITDVKKISGGNVFYTFIENIREYFSIAIEDNIKDKKIRAFLSAVILGDQDMLENKMRDRFLKTGTIHVLAVSGLHLGIITMLVFFVLGFCFTKRNCIYIFTLLFIAGYALIVGLRPSVLRAFIMVAVFITARLIGRQNSLINTLFIAACFVLLINPYDMYSVGFLFSFTIVFFLITLTPKVSSYLLGKQEIANRFSPIKKKSIYFFSGCLVAQAAVFPLVLYYNNLFSLSSFFVNVVLIPLMYPILLLGFLLVFFGKIFPFLIPLFQYLTILFSSILIEITEIACSLKWSYFYVASFSYIALFAYYAGLIMVLKKRFRKLGVVLLLGFAVYVAWNHYYVTNKFRITFLSLAQGEATFINMPGKENILIDAGSMSFADGGAREISSFLKGEGINSIDNLFVSHLHSDHYKAIFDLKENFSIGRLFLPDIGKKDFISKKLLYDISQVASEIFYVNSKSNMPLDTIKVLSPPLKQIAADTPYLYLNENSLVLLFCYKGLRGFFTGDIEQKGIDYLLQTQKLRDVDFVKVPHHGGADSFRKDFYDIVSPALAVIFRKDNAYFKDIEKSIKNSNGILVKTFSDGAIVITEKNHVFEVHTYKSKKRHIIKTA